MLELTGKNQHHNTIKWQLGKNWHQLHPNVQRRFNRLPTEHKPIIYKGVMKQVQRSKAGWLFAFLTRIIGNPLTPYQAQNVPMTVELSTKPGKKGVYWKRTYLFDNRKAYTVTSVKKDEDGRMMECVGGGFGMFLDIYAHEGALHFKSTRFFWKFLKFYIPLPHLITPGRTHVIHKDLGQGKFLFTISMDHPILGQTFFQTGTFHDTE